VFVVGEFSPQIFSKFISNQFMIFSVSCFTSTTNLPAKLCLCHTSSEKKLLRYPVREMRYMYVPAAMNWSMDDDLPTIEPHTHITFLSFNSKQIL
jgi:hypothetical protein